MYAADHGVDRAEQKSPAGRRNSADPLGPAANMTALQRSAGNQAVAAYLSGPEPVTVPTPGATIQRVAAKDVPWPSPEWSAEINGLDKNKGLLDPANSEFKKMKDVKGMVELVKPFKDSLLNPSEPASKARALLLQMRALAASAPAGFVAAPGALGPSKFSKNIYTGLLEVVNAKLLWAKGDHELHPWPASSETIKPDFSVSDELPAGSAGDVGDHVKVTDKGQLDQLVDGFGQQVQSKLSTYKDRKVRVVVDLVDNKIVNLQADEKEAEFQTKMTGLKAALGAKLKAIQTGKDRLLQVDAVLPGDVIYTYKPADWA